jgi:hypothetical protein
MDKRISGSCRSDRRNHSTSSDHNTTKERNAFNVVVRRGDSNTEPTQLRGIAVVLLNFVRLHSAMALPVTFDVYMMLAR